MASLTDNWQMNGFESSLEHLMSELERIDLRLRLQVSRLRLRNGHRGEDDFRGLYISEEEVDSIVGAGLAAVEPESPPAEGDGPLPSELRQLEEHIARQKEKSLAAGARLRLFELGREFGLDQFETDTLLICLLPEIDVKYERIYAYLHDDVTRRRPSINLVLNCLLDDLESRVAARNSFLPHSPLIAHQLLRIEDDSTSRSQSLLSRNLKIEDRVVNYLFGFDQTDSRLRAFAITVQPSVDADRLVMSEPVRRQVSILASTLAREETVIYLEGPKGVGKKTTAEALSRTMGIPLLVVDVAGLLASDLAPDSAIGLVFREARLLGSALCWDRLDLLISDETGLRSSLEQIVRQTNSFKNPTLATGEAAWQPGDAFPGKSFLRVELPLPSYDARSQLWKLYLDGNESSVSEMDLEAVVDRFRFTPAQIRDAAVTARNLSISRGDSRISVEDLYAACRVTSNQRLRSLARKIQPKYAWGDIVLPKDQMAQLREITNFVRHRHVVYAEWNFERKVSLGRGLNILFTGPSGTGKTMAAEIIASQLGLDLYKIDLSTVVSKYIGETEKNLDKIFTEAQSSNAILFFDEADAVFGKRSEVRDSHDRYANIEIAYLLQKTEEYDGIVILATNLRKNLDEAFARRMHFSIEFPLPEEADRRRIWQTVFPPEAPVAEALDLKFMARQFKITGGNIKNIAIGAAFLAAEDGGTIRIDHLIRATKREYQKIGRLCTETDFGPYFDLVRV